MFNRRKDSTTEPPKELSFRDPPNANPADRLPPIDAEAAKKWNGTLPSLRQAIGEARYNALPHPNAPASSYPRSPPSSASSSSFSASPYSSSSFSPQTPYDRQFSHYPAYRPQQQAYAAVQHAPPPYVPSQPYGPYPPRQGHAPSPSLLQIRPPNADLYAYAHDRPPSQGTSTSTSASAALEKKRRHSSKKSSSSCCQVCGVSDTPEWRKGPAGSRTLCNACGLVGSKMSFAPPRSVEDVLNQLEIIGKARYRIGQYQLPPGAYERAKITWIGPTQEGPNPMFSFTKNTRKKQTAAPKPTQPSQPSRSSSSSSATDESLLSTHSAEAVEAAMGLEALSRGGYGVPLSAPPNRAPPRVQFAGMDIDDAPSSAAAMSPHAARPASRRFSFGANKPTESDLREKEKSKNKSKISFV